MAQTKAQLISGASSQSVTFNDATVSSINGGPIGGTRNRIINGDMRIDQRNAGASVSAPADGYAIDRWKTYLAGGGAMTVQRSTTAPSAFTNSQLFTVTTADSSLAATDAYGVQQMIEGFNSADLAWGTATASSVTVSFWVRSSVTGTYTLSIRNNADTRSYLATYAISAANTFEYKTITIPGDTSGTWLTDNGIGIRVWFDLGAGSTYTGSTGTWSSSVLTHATGGTNWISTNGATFYITGVQLEAGSVATPFERRSYGQELALCQRYYWKSQSGYFYFGGYQVSSGDMTFVVPLPVTMRADPTVTRSGGWNTTNVTEQTARISASHFIVILRTTAAGAGYLTAQSDGIYTASVEL